MIVEISAATKKKLWKKKENKLFSLLFTLNTNHGYFPGGLWLFAVCGSV